MLLTLIHFDNELKAGQEERGWEKHWKNGCLILLGFDEVLQTTLHKYNRLMQDSLCPDLNSFQEFYVLSLSFFFFSSFSFKFMKEIITHNPKFSRDPRIDKMKKIRSVFLALRIDAFHYFFYQLNVTLLYMHHTIAEFWIGYLFKTGTKVTISYNSEKLHNQEWIIPSGGARLLVGVPSDTSLLHLSVV